MKPDKKPLWEMTDEALMQRYQRADARAFETLYHRHADKIFGYLVKKMNDPTKADEVMQSVFLKLHQSRAQFNPSYRFVPWLFTICRTQLVDYIRKGNLYADYRVSALPVHEGSTPRASLEQVPSGDSPEGQLSANRAARALTAEQENLLQLRYQDGKSFATMAKILNLSESAVRQRVSRTVRGVKNLMGLADASEAKKVKRQR